jgi:hypothetical protein
MFYAVSGVTEYSELNGREFSRNFGFLSLFVDSVSPYTWRLSQISQFCHDFEGFVGYFVR